MALKSEHSAFTGHGVAGKSWWGMKAGNDGGGFGKFGTEAGHLVIIDSSNSTHLSAQAAVASSTNLRARVLGISKERFSTAGDSGYIAFAGFTNVQVTGTIAIGDWLRASLAYGGLATVGTPGTHHCFGKADETHSGSQGSIRVLMFDFRV